MFKIGDKVVYPMHGAGVIESIEEKEVLGQNQRYYVMRMPIGEMKVMIPVRSQGDVGLRQVIASSDVSKVLTVLHGKSDSMCTNWNRRYRANLEKIKTGCIFEVAEVVRNLSRRDREKTLSSGERKMLDNARQILLSELALAQNIHHENAERLLEEAINQ